MKLPVKYDTETTYLSDAAGWGMFKIWDNRLGFEVAEMLNASAWRVIERDGLPEADGWYLITAFDQTLKINTTYPAMRFDNQFWILIKDKLWTVDAIAWMPLPKAYEVSND